MRKKDANFLYSASLCFWARRRILNLVEDAAQTGPSRGSLAWPGIFRQGLQAEGIREIG